MPDARHTLLSGEARAETARAELAQALSRLQDKVTPTQVLQALGQTARGAAAPLLAPLTQRAKSAGGVMAIALAAAALAFESGRAAAKQTSAQPQAVDEQIGGLKQPFGAKTAAPEKPAAAAQPGAAAKGKFFAKALALSAASLAAGAAISSVIPQNELERRYAKTAGRSFRGWLGPALQTYTTAIAGSAGNAFGIAKNVGVFLNILALISLAAKKSALANSEGAATESSSKAFNSPGEKPF